MFSKRNKAFDIRSSEKDQTKLLEDEDISDRTPILDVLIEKWKYFNKYKKAMLDKYTKNAYTIKDAFDKIMKVKLKFFKPSISTSG